MRVLSLVLAVGVLTGCSGSRQESEEKTAASDVEVQADQVLVEVYGRKLMLRDAVKQVHEQMGPPPSTMPKGRVDMIHKRALGKVVDAFVSQALLAEAALKHGIEVTQEEKDLAVKKLSEQLPEDKTLDEFLGETEEERAQMEETMAEGIRVQKLLAKLREQGGPLHIQSDQAASDEAIDAYLKANPKVTQSRDKIILHLQRQQERQLFAEYIRTLHDAADIKHDPIIKPPKSE
ncbi:MAG: hypothetical protein HN341_05910 [Verrucomicrobia bacterium]|nr:hypothetical protein [Verrucomicrobiota bacterium]